MLTAAFAPVFCPICGGTKPTCCGHSVEEQLTRLREMTDDEYVAWREPNLAEKARALTPRRDEVCEVCGADLRCANVQTQRLAVEHEGRVASMCAPCAEAVQAALKEAI